jgi:hypothetical protein
MVAHPEGYVLVASAASRLNAGLEVPGAGSMEQG